MGVYDDGGGGGEERGDAQGNNYAERHVPTPPERGGNSSSKPRLLGHRRVSASTARAFDTNGARTDTAHLAALQRNGS